MSFISIDRVPAEVDVTVIGAGPGGLAAAAALTEAGLSVLLLDAGVRLSRRDRSAPDKVTSGFGGAGLYSDGKFSFFPSAGQLWTLRDRAALQVAYQRTVARLAAHGLDSPPLPETEAVASADGAEVVGRKTGWRLKRYPSMYLSLSAREALTEALERGAAFGLEESRVVGLRQTVSGFDVHVRHNRTGRMARTRCRHTIFSGGRFGASTLADLLPGGQVFRRLEVGVRIEQPSHLAFFAGLKELDPKLKIDSPDRGLEWRTFCACRNGETVVSETDGLWTVSGRADCPPTGRSNIGFNLRVLDESAGARWWSVVREGASRQDSHFRVSLSDVFAGARPALDRLENVFGDQMTTWLVEGLAALAAEYPSLGDGETNLVGPTIEGTGLYPALDDDLRYHDYPLWVVGDATGRFRGIVAALVSGYYAAERILAESLAMAEPTTEASCTSVA